MELKMCVVKALMALVILSVSLQVKWVGAQVHHVVGGDRGWDPSTDVAAWSSGRVFKVGDKIWFTYSAAQGRIVELNTEEEFQSCDVSNPIRMYTDGIDSVTLDEEGIRYFVSSNADSCKNGLKLHVQVTPQDADGSAMAVVAAAPTTPSGSDHFGASLVLLMVGLAMCYYLV